MTQSNISKPRLLTVNQFLEEHNFLSHGGLRFLLFNSQKNGLEKAIKRLGRKILIDEQKFFEWVNEQNGGNHA
jgi:hypothetical protein